MLCRRNIEILPFGKDPVKTFTAVKLVVARSQALNRAIAAYLLPGRTPVARAYPHMCLFGGIRTKIPKESIAGACISLP